MKKQKTCKLMLVAFMMVTLVVAMIACVKPEHTHSYGEWTEVTAATCTVAGSEERVCADCDEATEGHKETRAIEALGHSYGEWTEVTAATCTAKGSEERICSECSEQAEGHKQTRNTNALGHSYNNGEITTPATFNNGGEKTYSCTRSDCTESYTDPISKLGVPTAFHGIWESNTEGGNTIGDITITASSVEIKHMRIDSWDGSGNVITANAYITDTEVITVNLTLSDNSSKITVTYSYYNIMYTFEYTQKATYTIAVQADSTKGLVTLSEQAPYYEGDEVILTVTPNQGYEVESVTANGNTLTAQSDGTYIITVATESVTVAVEFNATQSSSTVSSDFYGIWTGSNGDEMSNTSFQLEITDEYFVMYVNSWSDGGTPGVFNDSITSFTKITGGYSFTYGDGAGTATIVLSEGKLVLTTTTWGTATLTKAESSATIDDYIGTWSGSGANGTYNVVVESESDITVNGNEAGDVAEYTYSGLAGYAVVADGTTYFIALTQEGCLRIIVFSDRGGEYDTADLVRQ